MATFANMRYVHWVLMHAAFVSPGPCPAFITCSIEKLEGVWYPFPYKMEMMVERV